MVKVYKITYYNVKFKKNISHMYYGRNLFNAEYNRLLGSLYIKDLKAFAFDRRKGFTEIC